MSKRPGSRRRRLRLTRKELVRCVFAYSRLYGPVPPEQLDHMMELCETVARRDGSRLPELTIHAIVDAARRPIQHQQWQRKYGAAHVQA